MYWPNHNHLWILNSNRQGFSNLVDEDFQPYILCRGAMTSTFYKGEVRGQITIMMLEAWSLEKLGDVENLRDLEVLKTWRSL